MILALTFFGFLGAALAGSAHDSNVYMDAVLSQHLQTQLRNNKMEPYALPDFHTEFKDKMMGISVNVKSDYSKGSLTGLTTARRFSSCSAPQFSFGNATLNCTLTFGNLEIRYDGKAKYGVVPAVTVHATTKINGVVIEVEVTTGLSRNYPVVKKFVVKSLGAFSTSFTGLGPLSGFLKMLTQTYNNYNIGSLNSLLNMAYFQALYFSASRITMPMP